MLLESTVHYFDIFECYRSRNYNVGYGRPSYNRRPLPRTSVYTRNAYSNGYRRSSSYNGFGLGLGQLAGVVSFDYTGCPEVP